MARRAVLFLQGRYAKSDIPFYRSLCDGAFLIAVDGGFRFFANTGLTPDLLIGDFDSIGRLPRSLPEAITVVEAEVRKDQTDAEMALRFCLERRFTRIDIVQPEFGDPDHYLGNLMMLRLVGRRRGGSRPSPKVRVIDPTSDIYYLKDDSLTIRDARGCAVSLVPLSHRVRYSCEGTDYRVRDIVLRPGDTRALRNQITARRARFSVVGEGLLICERPSR